MERSSWPDRHRIPPAPNRGFHSASSSSSDQDDLCLYLRRLTADLHPTLMYVILDHDDMIRVDEHDMPVFVHTRIELHRRKSGWSTRLEQNMTDRNREIQIVINGNASDLYYYLCQAFWELEIQPRQRKIPSRWIREIRRTLESQVSKRCVFNAKQLALPSESVPEHNPNDNRICAIQ
jgi:hypothetical protein